MVFVYVGARVAMMVDGVVNIVLWRSGNHGEVGS